MQSFKSLKKYTPAALGASAFGLVASSPAFAVTDVTWVTTAVTAFKDDMIAYIGAAVGLVFAVLALSVGVNKVMSLVKKGGK